jgi:hypothetical protein
VTGSAPSPQGSATTPGLAEQLQQLAQLHASGTSSEQEVAVAKAQMLGQRQGG